MDHARRPQHSGSFPNLEQHSRIAVDLDARVCCDREEFPARVRSLSLGGLFLEAPQSPPFGSPVVVSVWLPGEMLRLSAIVRWTASGGFGVQFGLLGVRETRVLTELLRVAPDGPVSRGRIAREG